MMDFAHAPADELKAYAENWEDQLFNTDPGSLQWVFLPAYPVQAVDNPGDSWVDWFREENRHADIIDYWASLCDKVHHGLGAVDPIVVGLILLDPTGEATPNIWDGSHRVGAAFTAGCTHLPAVLGIPFGASWRHVPAALREDPACRKALATILGPEPSSPASVRRHRPA